MEKAGGVIYSDKESFEKKLKAMKEGGAERLHVLSDFDRTLTTAFVDGESRPSLISVLRDGHYLTSEYAAKAHELFNKYHPIEVNPDISIEEKKKAMKEWWETHFELLLRSGLNKIDLEAVINSEKIKLRDGVGEFLELLHKIGIPLVILSSTGLGGDAIFSYLEHAGRLYKNTHVIANFFKWDREGRAVDYSRPVIHGMNKDETAISGFPKTYKAVVERKNVLLLGDSLGDLGMIEGFNFDNLIKIGFLNEDEEKLMQVYKEAYDVIITGDGNFEEVNRILKEIIR